MIASFRVDLLISAYGGRFFLKSDEYYQYEIEAKVLEDYLNKRFSHYHNDDQIKIAAVITAVDPEHGV